MTIEVHVDAILVESIILAGVGEVDLPNLDVEGIDVVISGTGEVRLGGSVTTQSATISGVGDYDAQTLSSAEARIVISGVGSATVRVSDQLIGTISGTGSICYFGSPTVDATITGDGEVGPCEPGFRVVRESIVR